MIDKNSSIYIAGHRGLVGSALTRKFKQQGYDNLITVSHDRVDLTDQEVVNYLFKYEQPEYVVLAAAKVGGIMANKTYRADFIYENLQIQNNVIHAAWKYKVKKLLFLGSSCIYPAVCPQPMAEDSLLTGPLERTNEPYAIAKIAGLKTCESYNLQYGTDFFSVMPSNLYGFEDNFDFETSHLLPALIRKFYLGVCLRHGDWNAIFRNLSLHESDVITSSVARELLKKHGVTEDGITIWGTGTPRREFMHVDDLADACFFLMQSDTRELAKRDPAHQYVNVGTGTDHTIREIAEIVKATSGYEGEIFLDTTKPDGTMRKLLSVERIKSMGWAPNINLESGVELVYHRYRGAQ